MNMNYEEKLEIIKGYAKELNFKFNYDLPEGDGGTIELERWDYKVLVDVSNDGFTLSTIHVDDFEEMKEKNFMTVKRIKTVKNYMNKY